MSARDEKLLALYRHPATGAGERANAGALLRAHGIDPDARPPEPPPPMRDYVRPSAPTRRTPRWVGLSVIGLIVGNVVAAIWVLPWLLGIHEFWYDMAALAYFGTRAQRTFRALLVSRSLRWGKLLDAMLTDAVCGFIWPTLLFGDLLLRAFKALEARRR
jgi:hypothetical protein